MTAIAADITEQFFAQNPPFRAPLKRSRPLQPSTVALAWPRGRARPATMQRALWR